MLDDLLLGFHEVHHLLRGQALPRPGVPLIDPLPQAPDRTDPVRVSTLASPACPVRVFLDTSLIRQPFEGPTPDG